MCSFFTADSFVKALLKEELFVLIKIHYYSFFIYLSKQCPFQVCSLGSLLKVEVCVYTYVNVHFFPKQFVVRDDSVPR